MKIQDLMKTRMLCVDGGFGSELIKHGLGPGELSERWNVHHPEDVVEIHRSFLDAGADIILANTFGANVYHYDDEAEMEQVIRAGIDCAKKAVAESGKEAFVAMDIGSTGKLLPPMGMLPFEEAVESFAKMIRIGVDAGADLIWVETMNDIYELKAAVLAARENCDLPVFATAVYDANARMLTGSTPQSVAAMLEGLGVTAIGINCGTGPEDAKAAVRILAECTSVPLIIKPNAGLPHVVDGVTCYDIAPADFAEKMAEIVSEFPGIGIVGGCCGTTPDHIRAEWEAVCAVAEAGKAAGVNDTGDGSASEQTGSDSCENGAAIVSSSQIFMDISDGDFELGTSVNAAENEDLLEDLQDGFVDSVMDLADEDADDDAEIINLKLAADGVDEAEMTKQAIIELQNLNMLPISVQSTDPETVRQALRVVNGKAMVNLTEATEEEICGILPVAAKYGAVVCVPAALEEKALALADDAGLPRREIITR